MLNAKPLKQAAVSAGVFSFLVIQCKNKKKLEINSIFKKDPLLWIWAIASRARDFVDNV